MSNNADYLGLVKHWYPNAISTNDAVDRLLTMIQERLGLSPHQIMSADSICCDDLNIIEYPQRAYEMLGPFKLGGLNGYPFAGLTGMGAFAHHVPIDGAIFIFFGPHIGLTRHGEIGESFRPGQAKPSACCGAATAAVNKLLRDEIIEGDITDLDYQQNTLEQILWQSRDRVLTAAAPLVEATEVIYEAIERRIELLISRTTFPTRQVILMGGILINGDHDIGSFCSYRRLTCLDLLQDRAEDWRALFDSAGMPA